MLLDKIREIPNRSLAEIVSQSTDLWDQSPQSFGDEFPYIEISAVRLGVDEYDIRMLATRHAPSRARMIVKANDIIISTTRPHRGAVAMIKQEDDGCIASTGFAVLRIRRDVRDVLREYLLNIIASPMILQQFLQRSSGGNYPAITSDEIGKVLVPIPSIELQQKLVEKMQVAQESRKKKLAQADELLAGIDKFLLKEVGVDQVSHSRRRCFGIRLRQVEGPINPDRYSALGMERNVEGATIGRVGDILEDKTSPSRVDGNGEWDWIRIDDLPNEPLGIDKIRTEYGKNMQGTFFTVEKDDILIARLGPTILNRKFVLCPETKRRTIASPEFLVLRCYKGWNPMLVLWILKTTFYRNLIYSKCRGGTPSRYRIIGVDLGALPFPSIDKKKQDELVNVIKGKLEDIRDLREEAERDWRTAKADFEAQILVKGAAS